MTDTREIEAERHHIKMERKQLLCSMSKHSTEFTDVGGGDDSRKEHSDARKYCSR